MIKTHNNGVNPRGRPWGLTASRPALRVSSLKAGLEGWQPQGRPWGYAIFIRFMLVLQTNQVGVYVFYLIICEAYEYLCVIIIRFTNVLKSKSCSFVCCLLEILNGLWLFICDIHKIYVGFTNKSSDVYVFYL